MRDHAADDGGDVLEVFRAVVLRFTEVFRHGAAVIFMHGQPDGVAADAVHAEREVEQRAERGQRPDDADPDGRRAMIALVQQRMAGRERAGDHVKARRDVWPKPQQMIKPVHRGKVSRKFYRRQAWEIFR